MTPGTASKAHPVSSDATTNAEPAIANTCLLRAFMVLPSAGRPIRLVYDYYGQAMNWIGSGIECGHKIGRTWVVVDRAPRRRSLPVAESLGTHRGESSIARIPPTQRAARREPETPGGLPALYRLSEYARDGSQDTAEAAAAAAADYTAAAGAPRSCCTSGRQQHHGCHTDCGCGGLQGLLRVPDHEFPFRRRLLGACATSNGPVSRYCAHVNDR